MDEPASSDSSLRELAERVVLAMLGAVALTAERADGLADELAGRGAMRRDEARSVLEDAMSRWRGDLTRLGERTGAGLHGAFRELGLVTREDWEELELRVAQLEHRLRLLETPPASTPPPPAARA